MKYLKRAINYFRLHGLILTFKRAVSKVARKITGKRKQKTIYYKDGLIHLAFFPTGGLGDYIISKAVLEDIIDETDCVVTIYCDKKEFAKSVYRDVSEIYNSYSDFDMEFYKYDLSLRVEHFVHVEGYKREKLAKYAPKLLSRIEYIVNNWDKLYVNVEQQWFRERIQFERCKIQGLDRWTELRMGEAFKIEDHIVNIPLDKDEKIRWSKENSGTKYITINCGADEMIPGRSQLKVWSRDNYRELIGLIKEYFSDVQIIQLGDKKTKVIEGVDRSVLGEKLEYVKHILRGSTCHIDCEGGLVHLATQLGTKCIVLFGPTQLDMYAYDQNTNLVSSRCSGCMGLHEKWAYDCLINYESPLCMSDISTKKVFDELIKVLENENNKQVN